MSTISIIIILVLLLVSIIALILLLRITNLYINSNSVDGTILDVISIKYIKTPLLKNKMLQYVEYLVEYEINNTSYIDKILINDITLDSTDIVKIRYKIIHNNIHLLNDIASVKIKEVAYSIWIVAAICIAAIIVINIAL